MTGKGRRFVESRLACVCGRSAFPPPRHAKQALRPVCHASLREMPPCPRGAALCGITPCTRMRTVGIPSASACQTGASPRSSRLSAGDASLPTRRGALWNHALHASRPGRYLLRLAMPRHVRCTCPSQLAAQISPLLSGAALYSCAARSFSAWAAVISGSMTSSRPPFKIASRW